MKLPNDLIKATDYDKAEDRIIHEFECVNGKIIQHYALGGEHELTTQEIVDCLNALLTIDCDLRTAYAYIKGQNDKIKVLEKTLELMAKSEWSDGRSCMKFLDTGIQVNSQVEYLEYFKTKAKEMIKSE